MAVTAELIAENQSRETGITSGEAFVCGLLHDLGKLALDRLLPKSYYRAAELAHRRVQEEERGAEAYTPRDREREVSKALQAYAAMTTSADKGAVRDITQIQR